MNRTPVQSSNVVSIGYDTKSKILEVEFKSGVYRYLDVADTVYHSLMASNSKGQFIHKHIVNHYAFEKVAA